MEDMGPDPDQTQLAAIQVEDLAANSAAAEGVDARKQGLLVMQSAGMTNHQAFVGVNCGVLRSALAAGYKR